ncbi:hypothetical protein LINGRAHAP2_LOCUS23665, partial [Linum grandiflorum]
MSRRQLLLGSDLISYQNLGRWSSSQIDGLELVQRYNAPEKKLTI